MRYEVLLTEDAQYDLNDIYDYIARHDAPAKAEYVLDKIAEVVESLADLPQRGVYPKELLALGIQDYREIFFKPYRVIYRIIEQRVYIYLIADGRRGFQKLLERRMFGA